MPGFIAVLTDWFHLIQYAEYYENKTQLGQVYNRRNIATED